MANLKEFRKGSNIQVAKNFNSNDWDCNCKYPECQTTIIDMDHVAWLQAKRDKWQKPVTIDSGYRCARHNQEEGGASNSRHKVSDATDIKVKGMTPEEVAQDCEDAHGMGRYDTFTHVDSRPLAPGEAKARWNFRKNP